MRLLIMTGSKLRHLYFASEIVRRYPDARILIEDFEIETGKNYTKEEVTPLMKRHFEEFDRTEKSFFESLVNEREALIANATLARIPPGTINLPENVEKILEYKPDLTVVHSTSIIKEPLISALSPRILNLHAGLSPYYRGAGTNLFPFINEELQYVGMTVHHLDAGIDSGAIVLQGRPAFDPKDNTHTIGCKCVITGVELMSSAIDKFQKTGTLPQGKKQDLKQGKLYLKKHFTDSVLIDLQRKLKDGLVNRYISAPVKVEMVEW